MTRVIELNDIGVVLAEDDRIVATSPGYALYDAGGPVLGEPARAAARLQPLRINNLFWNEFSTRPLARPIVGVRSQADLAYLHLKELVTSFGPSADCTILVPAEMTLEQLGLLRAVAQAAGLGRARIIDTAVAATRAVPGSGKFCHVDVELHRATLAELRVGARIERGRALVVPGAGQLGFLQRWLETIARDMVFATRFDPLAQGSTEQALFDAIPGLSRDAAANGRATLTVGADGNRHSIEITREQFMAATAALADEIVTQLHRLRYAGEASTIVLGARAAGLPGLGARLAELPDTDCFVLEAASPLAAVSGRFAPPADETHRVTSLPSLAEPERATLGATAVAAGSGTKVAPPSHLLYRGQAVVLEGQTLTIGTAVAAAAARALNVSGAAGVSRSHCTVLKQGRDFMVFDHSSYGTWLNEERVAHRARLKAGDQLRLGYPGIVLELIAIDAR